MSAYLNLTAEHFFEECKERIILGKVRVAQKQKVQVEDKTKQPPLWHTWFQLTSLDLSEGVILRATVPISVTLSNPWSEKSFEDEKAKYAKRHGELLKWLQEIAAKYYPAFGDKDGKMKEGEWSWGED